MKDTNVDKLINNSITNHYSVFSETHQHKDKYTQQMKKTVFHIFAQKYDNLSEISRQQKQRNYKNTVCKCYFIK